jgi:hypothetical protein
LERRQYYLGSQRTHPRNTVLDMVHWSNYKFPNGMNPHSLRAKIQKLFIREGVLIYVEDFCFLFLFAWLI